MRYCSARFRLVVLALTLLTVASGAVFAQTPSPTFSINSSPLPAPAGMVNDYAGVIDAATKQRLETRLRQFADGTNPRVELAVAVVRTTGERPIFDYSLAVARGWGIGSKEQDNPSVLLFVAVDDRKYFTQVSKDLEDELPDGLVGSLQRQYLVPQFRQANYGKGIEDTMEAYIRTIENKGNAATQPEASPVPQGGQRRNGSSLSGTFCCLLVILVLILIIFSSRGGGGGGRRRGGWGGGGLGGALPWIIGSAISNAASSSSSGWSSGGSSDWGSSGGGWGGFGGGGDFGGGGAGGDW
jgi:uncharacterized protein